MNKPELSVIIPIYNEADRIGKLFRNLAGQYGIDLEIIVSDGGSTDDSLERLGRLAGDFPWPVRVVTSAPGRGRQLNAGAAVANGSILLFLHADSLFVDSRALRKGADQLATTIAQRGDALVAGHFALNFDTGSHTPPRSIYYYASKARLHRPGCTHGDQGFMLYRSFFQAIGPFDETLPMLEDSRLAETIRQQGEWVLLPATIMTSTRRFASEGMIRRQLLNAIIMALHAIGRDTFLTELPGIYTSQENASRLKLHPFFKRIKELLSALPLKERLRFWYDTGVYVRSNAWQLAFANDVRRNFHMGLPAGTGETPLLELYDRKLDQLTNHLPGQVAAMATTWLWFKLTSLAAFLREYQLEV